MPALKDSPEAAQKPLAPNGAKGQPAELARGAPTAPAQTGANPFAAMRRFAADVDRFFDDFSMGLGIHMPGFLGRGHELLRREAGLIPAQWSPRVEVLQRKGQLVVRAELPGLSKDDVKVEMINDMLTIQGERKQEKKEEREGYLYNECSYGTFYRAMPLPEGIDATKAVAEFKNGVLEVTMAAPPQSKPQARRLEVQEKK